ncbi:NAD(P)H-quinone oxidoreductase subunit F [Kamptonema animale CS-326]|jgi:NAD(P)H-quinone oxidoreductase subunit 5|uniref:NAD(P)H-quinone oxidoreductase subunit F n=1 Tax=Kamptonema animale TaxID=92934 RepID=UPI00232A8055|nr:NAD(P)H-quinone oxidoreductase subunit F [Kamptonema animale]MDB9513125.1 NAD(P)H-quinone oxidoreductase subunit F [Kamptonema animale CS-326]
MAQVFLQTVWLIPCYPLIGAVLSALWFPGITRLTGPRPAGYLNALLTFIAFAHGVLALSATWNQPSQEIFIPWLNVAGLDLTIPLEISSVTVGATVLVTGLNLIAQIFAFGYMEMDWGWARFYSMLGLFEAGMCSLTLCNSLFFSYIILEILTLGTYLLIGLWFNQSLVVTGARDAFLTKRVGDLILLMGVVALLPLAGTWNFTELATWAQTATIDPTVATLLSLALIAGPMGKCAQFPLHLWLDEAMEGPMPATILRNTVVVSTGAWVLIKLQPVIALSPVGVTAMIFVGGVTAVGASLIAIAQIDSKRALSYSVSAYMGLVFIAVGTQQSETALTLLFTYAFAMSLLVMSTGNIIWNNITQDLTQMGGLWSRRPISGIAFVVGAAALVAVPPFGCFWSMLKMCDRLWNDGNWLFLVVLAVNGLTAFSLTREFSLIFGGKPKTAMTARSPELHWPFILPMVILMGFTLHVPLMLVQWQLLPIAANINLVVAGLLIASTAIGIGSGAFVYLNDNFAKPVRLGSQQLQDFFAYDLYTAQLYRVSIVFVVDIVSKAIFWIDRFLVDGLVNFVGLATVFSGQSLKYNVSGQTQFYALTIIVGVAGLMVLLTWPLLSRLPLIVGG